ncbi:PAS sensor domain-containing protein ['Osedax' symbiont bacterium Rs2_46_30_T18]|nr:PAS sensor domain-containing protein ['Osedax' symbiont bacterium Rs2_46_30_T18]
MSSTVSDQVLSALDKVLVVSKTDLEGSITYVNDLFCQLTGYSREELIGSPHSLVRHNCVAKSVYKEMWDTIKAGEIWSGIIPNVGKGGGLYVVDTTVQPIFNAAGEITEYISIRRVVNDLMADFDSVEQSKEAYDDYYEA